MAATPDSPAADSPRASSIPRSDDEDAAQSVHGDDDAGEETKDQAATPETTEKPARGKGKTGKERDANSSHPIGKIRHLKKEDGEPLWREDIQFDFLKAVFDNEQKVFTNSYDPEGIGKQNFADIYIDTMSRSTKTSKVLRDKLLSDREAAKGMAMVCLLVNMGRMNTTLNCMYTSIQNPSAHRSHSQSFQKCAHSCELTMLSPHYKRIKIRTRTNSYRMHHA